MLFADLKVIVEMRVSARWRLRKREFQKKKALIPFSLLLPGRERILRQRLYGCRRKTVPDDINKFEHCALGSFWVLVYCSGFCLTLSCVRFRRGFVNNGIVEPVSVSDVINSRLESVIIPSWFLFA